MNRVEMDARNAKICAYYKEHTLTECCERFQLKRARVIQILKDGEVWRPYARSGRDQFLGVNVSLPTKEKLRRKAERENVSVSRLASDVLDEALVGEE